MSEPVAINEQPFWNPYVAGALLGLVLLGAFVVLGTGLGASGSATRLGVTALAAVAPEHVAANGYLGRFVSSGRHPLNDSFVLMALGAFLGGLVSAYAAGRLRLGVVKGPRVSLALRLTAAVAGGVLMGVAARLARGCTSGQALTGGALLSVGAWVFMFAVFGGGYALAYFVRRAWR